jgi:hypothetical protein
MTQFVFWRRFHRLAALVALRVVATAVADMPYPFLPANEG